MSRIRTLNASITVECALVMPLILSVFTALIAFLLFIYNRNVLRDAAVLATPARSRRERLRSKRHRLREPRRPGLPKMQLRLT